MIVKKYVAPVTAEGVERDYERVARGLYNIGLNSLADVVQLEGAAGSITTIQKRGLPLLFRPLPEEFNSLDVDIEGMTQDRRNGLLLAAGKVGLRGVGTPQTLTVAFGAEALSRIPGGGYRSSEDRLAIVANILRFATAPGLEANIHIVPPEVELSFDEYDPYDALTCYRRNGETIGVSSSKGLGERTYQAPEHISQISRIVERCTAEASVNYPAIHPYDAAGQPLAPLELLGTLED